MSGNVSQMVNLLEMCLTTMDNDIPPKGVLYSTIGAVNAVHKVYVGMQVQFFEDLVTYLYWHPNVHYSCIVYIVVSRP